MGLDEVTRFFESETFEMILICFGVPFVLLLSWYITMYVL